MGSDRGGGEESKNRPQPVVRAPVAWYGNFKVWLGLAALVILGFLAYAAF